MTDDIMLRKALAMLRSFADNLPARDDIEDRYVDLYHSLLTDIANETDHEFEYFLIPESERERRITMTSFGKFGTGPAQHDYSKARYCKREMFLMKLNGAINYLNSFLPEPQKRIIGF